MCLLDLLFELSGEEGAAVCEISPAAYRQRLPQHGVALHPAESAEAVFDALQHGSEAMALMRSHPDHQAPEALLGGIRAVLQAAVQGSGQAPGSSSVM